MNKPAKLALAVAAAAAAHCSPAAIPLRWTVETSRVQPVQFDAYHGETMELEASLKSYSKDFAAPLEACIFWQTNGMGEAWWTAPASASGSVIRAAFTPEMDPGAAVVSGFLGATGENYRAAFQLRFRPSPGAAPNTLPLPTRRIDFSQVEVVNPPWPDSAGITTNDVCGIVTNTVETGFTEWEVNPATYNGFPVYVYYHDGDQAYRLIYDGYNVIASSDTGEFPVDDATNVVFRDQSSETTYAATRQRIVRNALGLARLEDIPTVPAETDPTVPSWAKGESKPTYTAGEVGAYPNASGEQLSSQVTAIGAHLNAEDAHFVSTNYDSEVRMPEAYVEVRLTDNGTNTWVTIWQEMRRWTAFVGGAFDWNAWGGFHAWATNVMAELAMKADRAWGAYDSETGGYSPDGCLQISSTNIIIAHNMAYQRNVTTAGNVWILQCNSGVAQLGGDTNGFFRVSDGDGTVQFEIVKGDRMEVGADADGITVSGGVVTIPYSVEAGEHPTIQCCNDLAAGNWKAEGDPDCLCTVSWSGSSGAYVATVTPKAAQTKMFAKATYMRGGETYIRNVAPVSVGSGILCTDGVHKVRPVYSNGAVTWEVVQ